MLAEDFLASDQLKQIAFSLFSDSPIEPVCTSNVHETSLPRIMLRRTIFGLLLQTAQECHDADHLPNVVTTVVNRSRATV